MEQILVASNITPPTIPHTTAGEQIIEMTKVHCDLVQARLGDIGFKEYFEMNRRWLEAMQGGGAARLDYSSPPWPANL
jgi:hypothetical protein